MSVASIDNNIADVTRGPFKNGGGCKGIAAQPRVERLATNEKVGVEARLRNLGGSCRSTGLLRLLNRVGCIPLGVITAAKVL